MQALAQQIAARRSENVELQEQLTSTRSELADDKQTIAALQDSAPLMQLGEAAPAHAGSAPQNGAAGSAPRHMTPCACHCAVCRAAGHGNKCVVLRMGLLRLFHGEADPVDLVLQHYYHGARGWDKRFDAAILSVQYGPAGDVIAAGGKDGLHLICAQTGVNLLCLKGHSAQINGVGFSLDGTMLASCSGEYVKNQYGEHGDNSVRLWDVGTGKELKKLEGHSDTVWECKFAPKGDIIVSGSSDKTLKIWDVESGTCQATLEGHSGGVSCVSFSPADPGQLVTGSHDKTVKLWSVADGQCLQTLKGHSDYVRTLSWTCDGNLLASGGDDERIILWDAKKGERLMELKGHSGQVWCLEWAPDGSQLVCSLARVGTFHDEVTGMERLHAFTRSAMFSAAPGFPKTFASGHTREPDHGELSEHHTV